MHQMLAAAAAVGSAAAVAAAAAESDAAGTDRQSSQQQGCPLPQTCIVTHLQGGFGDSGLSSLGSSAGGASKHVRAYQVKLAHTAWLLKHPCTPVPALYVIPAFSKGQPHASRSSHITTTQPLMCVCPSPVTTLWVPSPTTAGGLGKKPRLIPTSEQPTHRWLPCFVTP